jgi:hypothetical protein
MTMRRATNEVFDGEEVREVLSGTFYASGERPSLRSLPGGAEAPQKPAHYKVICISMYNDDLARLDAMVEQLKERGLTKANRSALIRMALDQVDLSKAKRGM